MIAPRQDIARLQSDFYRLQYHKVLNWLLMSVFIMFLLIAAISYYVIFQPSTQYYANTSEGKILPMVIS